MLMFLAKSQDFHQLHLFYLLYQSVLEAFDWVMSLEPHWFSTIFGIYIFAGSFVSGNRLYYTCCFKIKELGYLKELLMRTITMTLESGCLVSLHFGRISGFLNTLLIWYANIPEETEYYVLRSHHGWGLIFWANLLINWTLPFFLLMSREAKRNASRLKLVACILLCGHFLDLYLYGSSNAFPSSQYTCDWIWNPSNYFN